MCRHVLLLLLVIGMALGSLQYTIAQSATPGSQSPDPHSVPSLDGGIGPCTADFTVADDAAKPVYNAVIKVHIAYGTWSVRKLDLQINTNVDGKARFIGLPNRLKRGLLFQATESDRYGEAFDDPAQTCNKQFNITLQKRP